MKAKYELVDIGDAIVSLNRAKDYMEEFREEFSGNLQWLELYTIYKMIVTARDLVENCDNLVKEFRLRNRNSMEEK